MGASGNKSKQSSEQSSKVWKLQAPFLEDLYQAGSDIALPGAGAAQTDAGALGQQFAPGMLNAFNNVSGLTDPTAQITAMSNSLQAGLGDLFRNQINPAIEGSAINTGGFGGGRMGVAQGVATGQLANAFTQGYGDIVADANRQSMGAAGMLPGLAMGAIDNSMAGSNAGLDILQRLGAILGNPTVLSRGSSSGKSSGFGFNL